VIARNFMHRSFVLEEGRKVTKVRQRVKRKEVGRIGIIEILADVARVGPF
jgi:hypothetical protein